MIASTIDRLIVHKVEAFPSEAFAQGLEPRLMLAEENNLYHENPVLCIEVKQSYLHIDSWVLLKYILN